MHGPSARGLLALAVLHELSSLLELAVLLRLIGHAELRHLSVLLGTRGRAAVACGHGGSTNTGSVGHRPGLAEGRGRQDDARARAGRRLRRHVRPGPGGRHRPAADGRGDHHRVGGRRRSTSRPRTTRGCSSSCGPSASMTRSSWTARATWRTPRRCRRAGVGHVRGDPDDPRAGGRPADAADGAAVRRPQGGSPGRAEHGRPAAGERARSRRPGGCWTTWRCRG